MQGITETIHRFWLRLGRRLKTSFYLYLAVLFTFIVLADSLFLNITARLKQSSFDMMIKNRIIVAKPDPDIIIMDINEASLALMAKEYGRWPWPRQVLGEFVEKLELQHPRAIIFDILFADPDIYNPDSDSYFDDAIRKTDNTFFPFLRLDPANDHLSAVSPAQIPGVKPLAGTALQEKTIAVVLPHFESAINGGRLGIHNIYPDDDGVVRRYVVRMEDSGWMIPSLPARVAEWLGSPLPDKESILLNWRGKAYTYRYESFAELFLDMTAKESRRPKNEFAGKIVIIGSTAAGLFDIKPTPMAKLYPGVEIFATAIDNLRHADYLRVPDARLMNPVLALLIIWSTAFAFFRNVGQEKFDRFFGLSQFLLIGISYASINLMTIYINLTGPVTLGIAYFSIARIYTFAARKALEKSAVMSSLASEERLYAALLLIRFNSGPDAGTAKIADKISRSFAKHGTMAGSIDTLNGIQKGIWSLFEGTIAVSWTASASDERQKEIARHEAEAFKESAHTLWQAEGGDQQGIAFIFHEGSVEGGRKAGRDWNLLFGEALIRQTTEERNAS